MRIRLNCNSLEGNDYLFEDHLFQSFLRLSAREGDRIIKGNYFQLP